MGELDDEARSIDRQDACRPRSELATASLRPDNRFWIERGRQRGRVGKRKIKSKRIKRKNGRRGIFL